MPPRPRLIAVLILLWTTAGCADVGPAPSSSDGGPTVPVPVVKITDGDTIHVLRNGRDETVRLIGIDSPEVDWYGGEAECFGAAAGRFAERLLLGRRVRLELDREREDRYGRTLAYVHVGSRMANVELVRGGFAEVTIYPPNDRYGSRLRRAEAQARAEGAGLWSACG